MMCAPPLGYGMLAVKRIAGLIQYQKSFWKGDWEHEHLKLKLAHFSTIQFFFEGVLVLLFFLYIIFYAVMVLDKSCLRKRQGQSLLIKNYGNSFVLTESHFVLCCGPQGNSKIPRLEENVISEHIHVNRSILPRQILYSSEKNQVETQRYTKNHWKKQQTFSIATFLVKNNYCDQQYHFIIPILYLGEIEKKCEYHLKNGGILSTIVVLREENDSRTFYPLFTNNIT